MKSKYRWLLLIFQQCAQTFARNFISLYFCFCCCLLYIFVGLCMYFFFWWVPFWRIKLCIMRADLARNVTVKQYNIPCTSSLPPSFVKIHVDAWKWWNYAVSFLSIWATCRTGYKRTCSFRRISDTRFKPAGLPRLERHVGIVS